MHSAAGNRSILYAVSKWLELTQKVHSIGYIFLPPQKIFIKRHKINDADSVSVQSPLKLEIFMTHWGLSYSNLFTTPSSCKSVRVFQYLHFFKEKLNLHSAIKSEDDARETTNSFESPWENVERLWCFCFNNPSEEWNYRLTPSTKVSSSLLVGCRESSKDREPVFATSPWRCVSCVICSVCQLASPLSSNL